VAEKLEGGKYQKHYRTTTTISKKERDKELSAFILEVENGQHERLKDKKVREAQEQTIKHPEKITFADLVKYWLEEKESSFSQKTAYRFKELLDSRITPTLGPIPLDEIDHDHLNDFYASLGKEHTFKNKKGEDVKSKGLSSTTIKHHHRLMNMIFVFGMKKKIDGKKLIGHNPCTLAEKISVKDKRPNFYDIDEIGKLFKAADKENFVYGLIIKLAVTTCARRGELFALTWNDVGLDTGVIKVSKSLAYIPGKPMYIKDPKNNYSVRTVVVPPWVRALLKEHNEKQEKLAEDMDNLYKGDDYIFVSDTGNRIHPDTISSWFPEFLKKHNLRPISFHGLRHTGISYLIHQGEDVESIKAVSGHASSSTILKFYSHAYKGAQKKAAGHMEALNPDRTKKQA